MKIFLDTANIDEIKKGVEWGIVDGVTTNPTLIAKEGKDWKQVTQEIFSIVNGPISVEAISQKAEDIIPEARQLAKIGPQAVIKIPITAEGLKATRVLSREGIKVNMTLIFSPNQALLAAKAGAAYVSPFVGRLDDISHFGTDELAKIIEIFENYDISTEVIAASIRHPLHVIEAALCGTHIATVPFAVLEKMIKHPLTDIGIERFLKDWASVSNKKEGK